MTPPPDPAGGPAGDPTGQPVGDTAAPDTAPGPGRPSGGTGPMVFVVIAVMFAAVFGAVIWVVAGGNSREAETIAIVVPAGTADRIAAGEKVEVMPTRLEFRVGDILRIKNDDDVEHSVGPYQVKAGQEMVLRYGAPGMYEGYCPLSEGERYEIVVEP